MQHCSQRLSLRKKGQTQESPREAACPANIIIILIILFVSICRALFDSNSVLRCLSLRPVSVLVSQMLRNLLRSRKNIIALWACKTRVRHQASLYSIGYNWSGFRPQLRHMARSFFLLLVRRTLIAFWAVRGLARKCTHSRAYASVDVAASNATVHLSFVMHHLVHA